MSVENTEMSFPLASVVVPSHILWIGPHLVNLWCCFYQPGYRYDTTFINHTKSGLMGLEAQGDCLLQSHGAFVVST